MPAINPVSLSSYVASQNLPAPGGIAPNSWVVAVKLQNGQMKYLQFPTQTQALQDIQTHNYGVLIAPQNQPVPQTTTTPTAVPQSTPAAAPVAPVAPPPYQSPYPAVAYNSWMSSRSIAPNVAIQPTLWTVEVQQIRKWVQFATEQQADADIQRNRGVGVKIAPLGVQPAVTAPYAPIAVQQQSTPQPAPVAPRPPAAPAPAVAQTPPASSAGPAVKVGSLQVSMNNRVARGTLNATVQAIAGGCRLSVRTNHANPGDTVTYTLFVQRGGYYAQAAVLAQNVGINGTEGILTFDIDYAALSAQIGVPIATGAGGEIGGRWQTGHVWGQNSGGRPGGAFVFP